MFTISLDIVINEVICSPSFINTESQLSEYFLRQLSWDLNTLLSSIIMFWKEKKYD